MVEVCRDLLISSLSSETVGSVTIINVCLRLDDPTKIRKAVSSFNFWPRSIFLNLSGMLTNLDPTPSLALRLGTCKFYCPLVVIRLFRSAASF